MCRLTPLTYILILFFAGSFFRGQAQTCSVPLIFTGNEISDSSIILRWFALDFPDQGYQIDIQERGLPPSDTPKLLSPIIERDTFFSLEPQSPYTAYIRSLCQQDTSAWKTFDFYTALQNGSACELNIELQDNNCRIGGQNIPIFVKELPYDTLGVNVKLSSVRLIIEHPYPADLSISLYNPAGNSIKLMEHHGSFTDNFGNPADTHCSQVLEFSDIACQSVYDATPPFLGQYAPDQKIASLNDDSKANGKWTLEICDRASDDIGKLKHVALQFTQDMCPQAPTLFPTKLGDNSQTLAFERVSADSLRVFYSMDSIEPLYANDSSFTFQNIVPSDSNLILTGLAYNTTYHAWSFIYCDGRWIGPSCRTQFTTTAGQIDYYSDWEEESLCVGNCEDICHLNDPLWVNDGFAWNVNQGSTPTEQTGPEQDVFFDGNYLFKESSQIDCRGNESILQSVCLERNDSTSGIGFYYHMKGNNVGTLQLLVSENEWEHTDTLLSQEGDQGAEWNFQYVRIPDSISGPYQLRLMAVGSTSAFGDIALGDVVLIGMRSVSISEQLYYPDRDRDGYGNIDTAIFYCGKIPPDYLSTKGGDCNDQNPTIYPNAPDSICNGIDENCDGKDNFGGVSSMTLSIDSLQNPSCPDIANGYIAINIEGGKSPYSTRWSTGDSILQLDSLTAGEYMVEVTDSSSCQNATRTIILESAQPVSFSFEVVQRPSCPGPIYATAQVNISGGFPPYSIRWSNGEKGVQADSLEAESFHVVVTDSLGCMYHSETQRITPIQLYDPNIITVRPISCTNSSDGRIRVIASGSKPPLDILWNTGDTGKIISDLSSGYYSVLITDADGCTSVADSFFLPSPEPLELEELMIDPQRCAGEASAFLQAKVKGGTAPYAYRWLDPDNKILTGPQLNNVAAGLYSLSVTDSRGCLLVTDSILVKAQAPIHLDSLLIQSTTCPLSRDGQINFNVQGGNAPYQINWTDGPSNTSMRKSLSSGLYGVTITDALECKTVFSDLSVPKGNDQLDIELQLIDSLYCGLNDSASLRAEVLNGQPPYYYNWSAGEQHNSSSSFDTLQRLSAGHYDITVTDGIGCVGSPDSLRVDSLSPVQIDSVNRIDVQCPGGTEGQIQVYASSPIPPVNYSWSNGQTSNQIDSLKSGFYTLTISDDTHCQPRVRTFSLPSPDSIILNVDTLILEGDYCFQLDSIYGGTPPYNFQWVHSSTSTDSSICTSETSDADIYLEIEDDNGCRTSSLIYERPNSDQTVHFSDVQVYPNPFIDRVYLRKHIPEGIQLRIWDSKGVGHHESHIDSEIIMLNFSNLPSGIYFLQIKFESGKTLQKKLIKQ